MDRKGAPGEWLFTAVGEPLAGGGRAVDVFEQMGFITSLHTPGFIANDPLEVHPRIDGVIGSVNPINYHYSATYHDGGEVFMAFNSSNNFSAIQPPAALNELPSVAFSGDHSDIIWSTDFINGQPADIIGQGYQGTNKDPFFKEANAPVNSGFGVKKFTSISGHCGAQQRYAMCWWDETSQNIIYKFAHSNGKTSFKKDPNTASNSPEEARNLQLPTFIERGNFQIGAYAENLRLYFYTLAGKLILSTDYQKLAIDIQELPQGMYMVAGYKTEKERTLRQKVWIQ